MMEKILTVKVAAYNVEKYIRKCLDSFIDERYLNKVQIVIINNKCKDNTLNIIKEYEERHPTVFQVVAQENAGYASTFNRGFEIAKGKYFTHLDGDDWFEADELYQYISLLEKCESDLVVTNVRGICDSNGETKESRYENVEYGKEYSFDEGYMKTGKVMGSHTITVKTSLIKENNISVDLDNYIPEVEYELRLIPYAKTITYTGTVLYNYRTGYVEQASNYNNLQHKCDEIYNALMMFIDWMNDLNGISEFQYKYLANRIGNCANVFFYLMMFQKINFANWRRVKQVLGNIKVNNEAIYNEISGIVKIACNSLFLIYAVLANVYRRYKQNKKFNF